MKRHDLKRKIKSISEKSKTAYFFCIFLFSCYVSPFRFMKYRGISRKPIVSPAESFTDGIEKEDVLYEHYETLFYSPPKFDDLQAEYPQLVKDRKYLQYALRLRAAVVLSRSNLIITSAGTVIYDLPFYDSSKKYRYTDPKIIKITEKKQVVFLRGKTVEIDKAVWMGGNYSWNYYHLLFEFAIKFIRLNELNIPTDVPALIDKMSLEVPQYKNLIDTLNDRNRPIIAADERCRYKVRDLYYINCPNFIPPNFVDDTTINAADVQFDLKALTDLREFLLQYSSNRRFPSKIFISRRNVTSGRRPFNEEQIASLCVESGFEIVSPEEFSLYDQIAMFNRAEYIVGGSGAAFTNLLFCNNRCKVLILSKNRVLFSGFSSIAYVSGADLRYVTEEATKKSPMSGFHDPFEIDIDHLKKQLNDMFGNN